MRNLYGFFYLIIATGSFMVGYTIHGTVFYSILNFFFWPISLIYWLVTKQINLTVIKSTFGFLLQ